MKCINSMSFSLYFRQTDAFIQLTDLNCIKLIIVNLSEKTSEEIIVEKILIFF